MNADRELLKLAAKAAGKRVTGWNTAQGEVVAVLEDGSFWQPLHRNRITDTDGDALRLAVKLMEFEPYKSRGYLPCITSDAQDTRRAIVRAAAKIGKAMT